MCRAAAWLDYETTTARAREYVLTTTNALAEQARATLGSADLILTRVLDHAQGLDWPTIRRSPDLHDFLARLTRDLPQVQSVFLVDAKGFNAASSRAFLMKHHDDRQREYDRAALAGGDTPHDAGGEKAATAHSKQDTSHRMR